MDFDLSSVAGSAGGAVTAGSLLMWVFKSWTKSVNKRLEEHSKILKDIEIQLAAKDGKAEGESALIWREINTDKVKITKMQSQMDKVWEVIHQFAQPRISDLLKGDKKDDPFK